MRSYAVLSPSRGRLVVGRRFNGGKGNERPSSLCRRPARSVAERTRFSSSTGPSTEFCGYYHCRRKYAKYANSKIR